MSICSYMWVRLFSSIRTKERQNWAKLAVEQTLQRLKDQEELFKELIEAERKYHREVRERLGENIGVLQCDVLCLHNNFNLRGVLKFSLDEYKKLHKIPETGKMPLLQHLIKHQAYQACLLEHTITEVAALEAVFCALKNEGCLRIPLKLYLKNNQEHQSRGVWTMVL
ncbi:hypothetical protein EDB83DRAFT_2321435 [Lactarius deliciosus]|nr:hypothetical protein EDB83DRAFT_2321435 [Lactarius deliciosus]